MIHDLNLTLLTFCFVVVFSLSLQGKWDTAFEVACKKINPGLSKEDKDVEVLKAKRSVIKTYNRKMIRVS